MSVDRRRFLKFGGLAALGSTLPEVAQAAKSMPLSMSLPFDTAPPPMAGTTPSYEVAPASGPFASSSTSPAGGKADHTIEIGAGLIEYAPNNFLSTRTYNGGFPGPLLRFKEGQKTTVDIYNNTDTPEQLHWHGQFLPDVVDGAIEEGTPYIPARGMRRQVFTPAPSGLRFYHTHLTAGANLNMGQYTGEVGISYIEARDEPGAYDREVFLMLKEFSPYFTTTDGMDGPPFLYPTNIVPALKAASKAADAPSIAAGVEPYDLAYNVYTINGRQLGFGDPIKVKPGERVMFHIVNGSATEIRSLYLPGHTFKVVAMDGNPVPTQAEVPVLWLGTAERISAIVEMKQPGVWVMGDTDDGSRNLGMGIVVEYAGAAGKPVWRAPTWLRWDYRLFADPHGQAQKPDEILDMVFARNRGADDGFNRWTINGVAFDMNTMPVMFEVKRGTRYRLRMRNQSGSIHPIHMHRTTFEITNIAGHSTAGLRKDVAMIGGYQTLDIDFTPGLVGKTLFHCHMQSHMDFGFMALFNTV
jgi:FtsP/CotA-like multicopper oxidase with cupredoxin domain